MTSTTTTRPMRKVAQDLAHDLLLLGPASGAVAVHLASGDFGELWAVDIDHHDDAIPVRVYLTGRTLADDRVCWTLHPLQDPHASVCDATPDVDTLVFAEVIARAAAALVSRHR